MELGYSLCLIILKGRNLLEEMQPREIKCGLIRVWHFFFFSIFDLTYINYELALFPICGRNYI